MDRCCSGTGLGAFCAASAAAAAAAKVSNSSSSSAESYSSSSLANSYSLSNKAGVRGFGRKGRLLSLLLLGCGIWQHWSCRVRVCFLRPRRSRPGTGFLRV